MFETIITGVWDFLVNLWGVLAEMSPYLLLGFGVAGVLSVVIRPAWIEKHLGREGALESFKAALFGVPLPLCSCGVIPVSAQLRRSGAGKGPTTAFLISTPQTGVDSILVTYSLLGGFYAVYRPLVALVSGLLGGVLVSRLTGREKIQPKQLVAICKDCGLPEEQCGCEGDEASCCANPARPRRRRVGEALRYGFLELPRDIGVALLIGVVISGAISAFVPDDFFTPVLGGGILAMIVMAVLGVPVYVCATASVPVAAALIAKGVSPGAAIVFLMTGPATNAATLTTLWRVMGKGAALTYLLTVVGCAILSGLALDALLQEVDIAVGTGQMRMLPIWLRQGSAVVLLGLLGVATFWPKFTRATKNEDSAGTADSGRLTFHVEGMTCSHCVKAVTSAVEALPGVDEADVDLDTGRVDVTGGKLDTGVLAETVGQLGYKAHFPEEAGREGQTS